VVLEGGPVSYERGTPVAQAAPTANKQRSGTRIRPSWRDFAVPATATQSTSAEIHSEFELQGYLAHKKAPPPRTLQGGSAHGHTVGGLSLARAPWPS